MKGQLQQRRGRGSDALGRLARRLIVAAASWASIAALLGHLEGVARMASLTRAVFVPGILLLVLVWVWSRAVGDSDLTLRMHAGFMGGWWGTLGYDFVRVPLHMLGDNPFPPLRAYGMWLLEQSHATPLSDLIGVLFHFSNGLSFGLLFALVGLRWHWVWAVVWALVLESLAVVSAFGEVFAVRYAPRALLIAFAAHLFYGVPLGWVCQRAARARERRDFRNGPGSAALLSALFIVWFLMAWEKPHTDLALGNGELRAGPDALRPGWSDVTAGTALEITNAASDSLTLRYRHSSAPRAPGQAIVLAPAGTATIRLDRVGTYQILPPGRPWRSVFVAVHDRGRYVRRAPARSDTSASARGR